jgi:hypothetical protein
MRCHPERSESKACPERSRRGPAVALRNSHDALSCVGLKPRGL